MKTAKRTLVCCVRIWKTLGYESWPIAYCLMSNHIHAVPAREDSISILIRRVHSRYAQYFNSRTGRTGHLLWQNRFYGCLLAASHLWAAIAYVERNPIRARIVGRAAKSSRPESVRRERRQRLHCFAASVYVCGASFWRPRICGWDGRSLPPSLESRTAHTMG